MFATSTNNPTFCSVLLTAVLAALLGGAAALIVAIGSWPAPPGSSGAGGYFALAVSGACVGAAAGFAVGGLLAFHGSMLGGSLEVRSANAPQWGLISGLVAGISVGPLIAGAVGLAVNHFLEGSAYLARSAEFGLIAGPLLGILGWQTAFWFSDFLRQKKAS